MSTLRTKLRAARDSAAFDALAVLGLVFALYAFMWACWVLGGGA